MKLIIENKRPKKRKTFILKRNAGNVEQGIQMFNNATNVGALGSSQSGGQGMGESLNESAVGELNLEVQNAGGKSNYLSRAMKQLNLKKLRLNRTYDPYKKAKLEKEIDELALKINIVDPHSRTNNLSTINANNKEIAKLELELTKDSGDYEFKD